MLSGDELIAPYLASEPGTVGAFLASPPGRSAYVRAGVALAVIAAALGALCAIVRTLGVPVVSALVDLRAVTAAALAVSVAVGAVGVSLVCIGFMRDGRGFDRDGAAKRALLAHVVAHVPRLGITRASRMSDVRLRVRRVAKDTCVFTVPGGFVHDDIQGLEPSKLGAVDMVVSQGRLIVFYAIEGKLRYVKKIRNKEQKDG